MNPRLYAGYGGSLALIAAAGLGRGGLWGRNYRGYYPSEKHPRLKLQSVHCDMNMGEVEAHWVANAIKARRRREQQRLEKTMRVIANLAKATGPARQHFGYCRHPATKSKTQSDSLRRMLRGKRKW